MKTNTILQALVDKAARKGGGIVKIPAGTYLMNDALHLRSGVHLVGRPGVILKKVPSVSSSILPWVGYGQYEFQVKEPGKFKVGMGVTIGDKKAFGFYETVATIIGKTGKNFFIDRPFAHDYSPPSEAWVRSTFPLISGNNVTDVSIRHITLDGNPREQFGINGCRGGGIILLGAHQVVIENVEVTNYQGDAISFQQCTDVWIRRCHLHHNQGTGLHPGSGSVRYVMADNISEYNSGCGVFYCLRTKYSICENNILRHNGRAGISVGERDTDHLIRNKEATFIFKVKGDSMIGAGIYEGDALVIDRSIEAKHGNIVLAVLNNDFTVKRLYRRGGVVKLVAENNLYPPIVVKSGEELTVWGVVTYNLHKLL